MTGEIEPILGRYVAVEIAGRTNRVYFEEAGQGIPLLCLHTAGADARQFRHILNDGAITESFRVIAFDMPWHGKSSPPEGWQDEEYALSTELYIKTILAFVDALDLERPVCMGCSIGGRIMLQLAARHPDRFRALIGLQAAAFQDPCTTGNGWTGPIFTADGFAPRWFPGSSRRRRRKPTGTKRCGTTCRAAPASSKAICISTVLTATCVRCWRKSTQAAARSTC